MNDDREKYYEWLKAKAKLHYESIGRVFCPALNAWVVFNAKGFHHLSYKPDGKQRALAERVYKMLLVQYAAKVISSAADIYQERVATLRIDRKKIAPKQKIKQYAIVATVKGSVKNNKTQELRVIVLQSENDEHPIFWSIMRHGR